MKTIKDIANALGLSEDDVATQRDNLLHKFQLDDAAQVKRFVVRRGLNEPPPRAAD